LIVFKVLGVSVSFEEFFAKKTFILERDEFFGFFEFFEFFELNKEEWTLNSLKLLICNFKCVI